MDVTRATLQIVKLGVEFTRIHVLAEVGSYDLNEYQATDSPGELLEASD
jgi:hypothetical protein